MLSETKHVRVTADYGTATLWLAFPGEPVNALDLDRLREIDTALAAVERNRHLRTLVVRSALPGGFCAGLRPEALASLTTEADRGTFSWFGQQVCERLANLPLSTVAFIDGPCLGAGLELALTCDHRLCVARPTTRLGFPDAPHGVPPCLGGSVRLPRRASRLTESGRTLSGREAVRLGLVDRAFCERRAKIELRSFLDELDRRPVGVLRRPTLTATGFVAERREFVRSLRVESIGGRSRTSTNNPIPQFPAVVGLHHGDEDAARLVAEAVLRGGAAVVSGEGDDVGWWIDVALGRGFVTPLEAEQARGRVAVTDSPAGFERAGLVIADALDTELATAVRPGCVLAVTGDAERSAGTFPHPRRIVGLQLKYPRATLLPFPGTDADTTATLAAWLKSVGVAADIVPATPARALSAA